MSYNFADYEYAIAASQLVLAMLGMGATLGWSDFRNIIRRPFGIGFVLIAQFVLFPLVAFAVGKLLMLPPGIAVGLLLVVTMPSGSMSNILTHFGHGNLPLSITSTTASTMACLVITPVVLQLLAASHLPPDFHMPVARILMDIFFCMLIPLAIGMIIGNYARTYRQPFAKWMIRASLVALGCLVVGSLTSGRIDLRHYGWGIPGMLIAFTIIQIWLSRRIGRLARFNDCDAFTIAVEVSVRNCNLAILLKATLFPAGLSSLNSIGDGVLFVALFSGGAQLVIAAAPVLQRRRARITRQIAVSRPEIRDTDFLDAA